MIFEEITSFVRVVTIFFFITVYPTKKIIINGYNRYTRHIDYSVYIKENSKEPPNKWRWHALIKKKHNTLAI